MKQTERQRREIATAVIRQCRTLREKLWDEYLDVGAPNGVSDTAFDDWVYKTRVKPAEKKRRR